MLARPIFHHLKMSVMRGDACAARQYGNGLAERDCLRQYRSIALPIPHTGVDRWTLAAAIS
jgi:hypothetical protein